MSGLRLTRDAAIKGGSGPAITPGNAETSLLIKRSCKPANPPPPGGNCDADLAILRAWINEAPRGRSFPRDDRHSALVGIPKARPHFAPSNAAVRRRLHLRQARRPPLQPTALL
jgi:hypothetical protein